MKVGLDSSSNSQNHITINFADAKFVSDAGVAAGYIVTALGLIASPIITYQSSKKNGYYSSIIFPLIEHHLKLGIQIGKLPDTFLLEHFMLQQMHCFVAKQKGGKIYLNKYKHN